MLRFRPRVGPFVWTPGRRRSGVPSMPGITFRVVGAFALGIGLLVLACSVGR